MAWSGGTSSIKASRSSWIERAAPWGDTQKKVPQVSDYFFSGCGKISLIFLIAFF
jgi:hypothetical protein